MLHLKKYMILPDFGTIFPSARYVADLYQSLA